MGIDALVERGAREPEELRRRVATARARTTKVDGDVVSQYVWANDLQIEAELDKTGKVVSRFVYGTRINVPELVVRPAENKVYQVITDHLGSPVLVVNVTDPDDVMMAAHYDAWGVATLDETASADGSWPIPHGFAGGLYDEDTGFVRFGARDYDPRVGRCTGKDPILFGGGQANLYAYVFNGPVTFVDPDGEFAIAAGGALGGVAGGAAGAAAAPFAAIGAVGALAYVAGTRLIDSYFANQVALQNAAIAEETAVIQLIYSKSRHEREGDGTRVLSEEEIRERFKDRLGPGEIKKLIEKVQKIRGTRNKGKRGKCP